MKKTYWSVKTSATGYGTRTLYFKHYTNAKIESEKDYRDKPVKHTVKLEKFENLENIGAFID